MSRGDIFARRGPSNRREGAATAPAFSGDFAALAASYGLTVRGYWRGDLGVSGSQGTGKAAWANQSGSSTDITSGLANGVGSVGAGLSGKASIITNGVDQNCLYTMPVQAAPLTFPTHKWCVAQFLGTDVSRILWSANNSAAALSATAAAAPARNFLQYDGAVGGTTTVVVRNQWYRIRASYLGDATSRVRIGADAPAPADCGNTVPAQLRFLCGGAANGNLFQAEVLCWMEIEGSLANFLLFDADAGPKARAFWTSAIEI